MKEATKNSLKTLAIGIASLAVLLLGSMWCVEKGGLWEDIAVSIWVGLVTMAVLYFTGILTSLYKLYQKWLGKN